MLSVVVWVAFDIFFVSVLMATIVHYFIPSYLCSEAIIKIQGILLTVVRKYRSRFLKTDSEILAAAGIDKSKLSRKQSMVRVQRLRKMSTISIKKDNFVEHNDIVVEPINEANFNTARFFCQSIRLSETFRSLVESKIVLQYRTIWPRGLWDDFYPREVYVDYLDITLDNFKSAKFLKKTGALILSRIFYYLSKFNLLPLWLQDIIMLIIVNICCGILVLLNVIILDYRLERLVIPLCIFYVILHFIAMIITVDPTLVKSMQRTQPLPNDYDDKKEQDDVEALYDIDSTSESEEDEEKEEKSSESETSSEEDGQNEETTRKTSFVVAKPFGGANDSLYNTNTNAKYLTDYNDHSINDDDLYNVNIDSDDEADSKIKARSFHFDKVNFDLSDESADEKHSGSQNHLDYRYDKYQLSSSSEGYDD